MVAGDAAVLHLCGDAVPHPLVRLRSRRGSPRADRER
jgi:hypothetical protein